MRILGSLRILLIYLRIMDAMLVYEMLFGMGYAFTFIIIKL